MWFGEKTGENGDCSPGPLGSTGRAAGDDGSCNPRGLPRGRGIPPAGGAPQGSKVAPVVLGAAYQVLGRSAGVPCCRGASPGFLLPERGEPRRLEAKQRPPPPNAEIPRSLARHPRRARHGVSRGADSTGDSRVSTADDITTSRSRPRLTPRSLLGTQARNRRRF